MFLPDPIPHQLRGPDHTADPSSNLSPRDLENIPGVSVEVPKIQTEGETEKGLGCDHTPWGVISPSPRLFLESIHSEFLVLAQYSN